MQQWVLDSWREGVDYQPIDYGLAEQSALQANLRLLAEACPIVSPSRILACRRDLQAVAEGRAFILHAGDCAERFTDLVPHRIEAQMRFLGAQAEALAQALEMPVICVGRIAGQFAKPRSELEQSTYPALMSYRGDLLNGEASSHETRRLDPNRLWQGYELSQAASAQIMKQSGSHFYLSHEALHLAYESALTREVGSHQFFNLSTHLPWIGMRTAFRDAAHVEFVRGLQNPIALKIGPHMDESELCHLVECLNPDSETNRLLLIYRLGADRLSIVLPRLLQAVKRSGFPVLWLCDPMHGNTMRTRIGFKTRCCDVLNQEVESAVKIHQELGVPLHGLHLEMTHERVLECMDLESTLEDTLWQPCYRSAVDPRLNPTQSTHLLQTFAEVYSSQLCV